MADIDLIRKRTAFAGALLFMLGVFGGLLKAGAQTVTGDVVERKQVG